MKTFANLSAFPMGEVMTFLDNSINRRIIGVTSHALLVLCQSLDDDQKPVLFDVVQAGQFDFTVSHSGRFHLWFEALDFDAPVVLNIAAAPFTQTYIAERDSTWTTVGHRPSINPELAALQLQMRQMQFALKQSSDRASFARNPSTFVPPVISEDMIEPAADPVVEPVVDSVAS